MLVIVIIAAAAVVLIWTFRRAGWLGLRDKTAWDWAALLLVPALLAVGAGIINVGQQRVAEVRDQESALQAYFDRISSVVLDDGDADTKTVVGRAQTAAVLRTVDGPRAGRVLVFLDEMGLLAEYEVSLEGLDLSDSELKGIDLSGLDFEDADLSGSDLEDALLGETDLEGADLRNADLKDAVLTDASLEDADLGGADLDHADLRGADLRDAAGLSPEQLEEACFDASTRLPEVLDRISGEGCSGSAEDDD